MSKPCDLIDVVLYRGLDVMQNLKNATHQQQMFTTTKLTSYDEPGDIIWILVLN